MARYVTLLRFTEKGASHIAKSTSRAKDFNRAAADAGVKVLAQYWTVGAYDGVLILEGADENAVLRVLAELAAAGNVRTASLRALSDTEFDAVVGA
jgi:uncharacterized protein with GYD domain